jgi:hypothetical protein
MPVALAYVSVPADAVLTTSTRRVSAWAHRLAELAAREGYASPVVAPRRVLGRGRPADRGPVQAAEATA